MHSPATTANFDNDTDGDLEDVSSVGDDSSIGGGITNQVQATEVADRWVDVAHDHATQVATPVAPAMAPVAAVALVAAGV